MIGNKEECFFFSDVITRLSVKREDLFDYFPNLKHRIVSSHIDQTKLTLSH